MDVLWKSLIAGIWAMSLTTLFLITLWGANLQGRIHDLSASVNALQNSLGER